MILPQNIVFALEIASKLCEACNIETDMNAVKCKECEYLMFSDMYGECSKNYKGIVPPMIVAEKEN